MGSYVGTSRSGSSMRTARDMPSFHRQLGEACGERAYPMSSRDRRSLERSGPYGCLVPGTSLYEGSNSRGDARKLEERGFVYEQKALRAAFDGFR